MQTRKLPLAFYAHKDLADLTETIMGDVNRMEHVWSHVLCYLYGSYISTAVIALILLFCDWRMTIASLWGVPVAFALLFGSRKLAEKNAAITKAASVIMRLGVATTVLLGTTLILSGDISFMTLFMFLMLITRVYAPFD